MQQMDDPCAMDMYSGSFPWSPRSALSVAMISRDKPDDGFGQSAQTIEDPNFRSQPTVGFQVSPADYSYPNGASPWPLNTAWMESQWQDEHRFVQGSAPLYANNIPLEHVMDSLLFHNEMSYPQIAENPIYHGDSEEPRSGMEQLNGLNMEQSMRDHVTWQNDQEQHGWAIMPSCMTPYPVRSKVY